jgi:hypothetical protein
MALRLKSFSQPDQLRRFQQETLLRLIEPHRVFFEMKGLQFPGPDGEIDLPALAGILAEPDEEMPSSFDNGLCESLSQGRGVTDQRRGCVLRGTHDHRN